jgi:hypothetical protein
MPEVKITDEIARKMRTDADAGVSFGALAKTYGVSKSIAHRHVTRQRVADARTEALPIHAERPHGERRDAEERLQLGDATARADRAPGQPRTSPLEPREWLEHQVQLAEARRDPERQAEAERVLREWDAN